MHHSKIPVGWKIQPEPTLLNRHTSEVETGNKELKDLFQRMWVVSVASGGEHPETIGRGIAFKKKNAKMTAAKQALGKLKELGIEKA